MSELKTASVDLYVGVESKSITFQYETNQELIEALEMIEKSEKQTYIEDQRVEFKFGINGVDFEIKASEDNLMSVYYNIQELCNGK